MALAWLKARRVAELLDQPPCTVIGADTVCVHDRRILGQPGDRHEAGVMIRSMRNTRHRTISGVCLYEPTAGRRLMFYDAARVNIGHLPDDTIDAYLDSDDWQGKAGGYNLADRQNAGWPIECEGDPGTVMGLPMRRLGPMLDDWHRTPRAGGTE